MNVKNQIGPWSIIAVSVLIGLCIIGASQNSNISTASNTDTAQPNSATDDTANQYGSSAGVPNNTNTYPVYPRPVPSSEYVAPRPSQPTTYIRPALGGGYYISGSDNSTTYVRPALGGGYMVTGDNQPTTYIRPALGGGYYTE